MSETADTVRSFFDKNPEHKDGVIRAYYAYHAHLREDGGHNFLVSDRAGKCLWCGRSREQVRWGNDGPKCDSKHSYMKMEIDEVISKEEALFEKVLERAKKLAKTVDPETLTGIDLAKFHHTNGVDPSMLDAALSDEGRGMLSNQQHEDYLTEYEKHKASGKKGLKKAVIKVKEL